MPKSRQMLRRFFHLSASACVLIAFAGCSRGGSSDPGKSSEYADRDCASLEPSNPYDDGSGHFAGYQWAEENGGASCNGNSDSFNEGCEEYGQQAMAYQRCKSGK
jgi:hypothetical protein